jgi:hypothetical protein
MTEPNPMDPQAYVTAFCQRMHEARRVPFEDVSTGDWQPEVGHCHQNVAAWVERHPDHIEVHGWVVWHATYNGVRMTHHSVVQTPDGLLIDITPLLDESYRAGMRFVRHVGDEQTFWEIKATMNAFDCYDGEAA